VYWQWRHSWKPSILFMSVCIFGEMQDNESTGGSHMVFQLNWPSYEILRRWGSFVKSTLLMSASRPTKNSSNDGASRDSVANTRPVEVKLLLISRPWSRSVLPLRRYQVRYLLFCIDHNAIGVNSVTFRTGVLDDDSDLSNLIHYLLRSALKSRHRTKKMP